MSGKTILFSHLLSLLLIRCRGRPYVPATVVPRSFVRPAAIVSRLMQNTCRSVALIILRLISASSATRQTSPRLTQKKHLLPPIYATGPWLGSGRRRSRGRPALAACSVRPQGRRRRRKGRLLQRRDSRCWSTS